MCGFDVPRVGVNERNDSELQQGRGTIKPGKRCGAAGIQNLSGTIGRTHLHGAMDQGRHEAPVITGPIGWGTDKRRSDQSLSRSECQGIFGHTTANASICARTASFASHPGSPPRNFDALPGGGRTQGAKISHTPRSHTPRSHTPRSHTPRSHGEGYDPTKHSWYHAKGRENQERLRQEQHGKHNSHQHSWGYDLRKSKDHIGYANGQTSRGSIQSSAVSREVPDWMVGVRMLDPPYDIPRFPARDVINGKLELNTRVFERAPNFAVKVKRSTLERPRSAAAHPTSTVREKRMKWVGGERPRTADERARSSRGNVGRQRPHSAPTCRPPPSFDNYKGTYQTHVQENQRCLHGSFICDHHPCNPHNTLMNKGTLIGTGCVVKRTYAPKNEWVGIDPKIPGGA